MKALFILLVGLTIVAFIALVVLAYIGAITDDYHVWQVWFVTLMVTVILGGASAFLATEVSS